VEQATQVFGELQTGLKQCFAGDDGSAGIAAPGVDGCFVAENKGQCFWEVTTVLYTFEASSL
jgi:hypothetical protein